MRRIDRNVSLIAVGMSLGLTTQLVAQTGYEIDRAASQVVIDKQNHWESWSFAAGTITIADDQVQPHRLTRKTNAVLDAVQFLQARPPEHIQKEPADITLADGIEAGSNKADVINALDGNRETYWEPDPPTVQRFVANEWWFSVDLGRAVIANKIVVRFVEEGAGDPFLLFDVLVADGIPPATAPQRGLLDYVSVLKTLRPNKTQRVFEFDLEGLDERDPRKVVRTVQIVARGSDFDRGEEVADRETYDLLDAADRGLIEYNKRLSDTREASVSEAVFERLDPERRGEIRYFRRERPRLAELEVWGEGEEIAIGTTLRGGSVASTVANTDLSFAFDGDTRTDASLTMHKRQEVFHIPGDLFFDLGSYYWIDAQRMITTFMTGGARFELRNYSLEFSDGSRHPDGSLKWNSAVSFDGENFANGGRLLVQEHRFELVKARFFQLLFQPLNANLFSITSGKARIAEIQLFGVGYQPQVVLESDVINLGGNRNLTTIEWDAITPTGTQVQLQSRTGNTLLPDTLYFRVDGTPLSQATYYSSATKRAKQQGEKRVIFLLGPDWSNWSAPYTDPAGSPVTSPSPREFMLLRSTLLSDTPDTAATLSAVRVNFSEPVADRILGSVAPGRIDSLGVPIPFTLFVRPEQSRGFNELLLTAPSGMSLTYTIMYSGAADDLQDGADRSQLAADATLVPTGEDSLHLAFPMLAANSGAIRLEFEGTLFSLGGQLRASVRQADGNGEGVWQRVDPQPDPTSLHVVAVATDQALLGNLKMEPRVVTPNDDGINDVANVDVTVFIANLNNAVDVSIYDLSGRLVRSIREQRAVSAGNYSVPWDGLDDTGKLVPPGLYSVLVSVDAPTSGSDISAKSLLTTVAVTY